MKPLDALPREEVGRLSGVVFDLDDTLLDHGALSEAAYSALFRLRETGLRLVACTGRPALWAELAVRQWPIDAAVAENGAIAFAREPATTGATARVVSTDGLAGEGRARRRAYLQRLAAELCQSFPETELADDNTARITDVTLDIGEHRRVPLAIVGAMRARIEAQGVRTFVSSVHLHLTLEPDDKASGVFGLLVERFGEDPTGARARYAYVGDSENDAAAFAAFLLTFGVANIRSHVARVTVPPRYVASAPRGAGFAEIAARLARLRGKGLGR